MTRTGPQKYPGASTAYWYQGAYPGSAMETNVILWHSTEGTSLPTYGGGASAPNLTAKPDFAARKLVWYQHFDFDTSSRALVNKAGGVETNTLNVCQIEIVGTCDPATHQKWANSLIPHLYMPELPDWAVRDLATFARWAYEQHGVPLTSGLTFKPYPSSYGSNGVRMSASQWSNFRGHCGHQHAPENDHGDPGSFPMAAILTAAKGGTIPEEDTVALTAEEHGWLKALVDNYKIGPWLYKGAKAYGADGPETRDAYEIHRNTNAVVRDVQAKVNALGQISLTDAQLQALADKIAASPGLAEAIAELVADKFAARLAE